MVVMDDDDVVEVDADGVDNLVMMIASSWKNGKSCLVVTMLATANFHIPMLCFYKYGMLNDKYQFKNKMNVIADYVDI